MIEPLAPLIVDSLRWLDREPRTYALVVLTEAGGLRLEARS